MFLRNPFTVIWHKKCVFNLIQSERKCLYSSMKNSCWYQHYFYHGLLVFTLFQTPNPHLCFQKGKACPIKTCFIQGIYVSSLTMYLTNCKIVIFFLLRERFGVKSFEWGSLAGRYRDFFTQTLATTLSNLSEYIHQPGKNNEATDVIFPHQAHICSRLYFENA